MSIAQGTINLAMIATNLDAVNELDLAPFAARVAPPLAETSNGVQRGWVPAGNPLATEITPANSQYGNCLYVAFREAERRVPAQLLQGVCSDMEARYRAEMGLSHVPRKWRRECREEAAAMLQRDQPPTYYTLPMLLDGYGAVYAEVGSLARLDQLCGALDNTLACSPVQMTCETIARAHHVDPLDLPAINPWCQGGTPLGAQLLTWLWLCQAQAHAPLVVPVAIEGPLTLQGGANGATVRVTDSTAPLAQSTLAALRDGMVITRARLHIGGGHDVYSFTYDADADLFRALTLPVGEAIDPTGHLLERVEMLSDLGTMWRSLVMTYIQEMTDMPQVLRRQFGAAVSEQLRNEQPDPVADADAEQQADVAEQQQTPDVVVR